MMTIKKIFFSLLVVFVSTAASRAYDTDELSKYQDKYASHMAVVLDHKQSVSMEIDKKTGELAIYETDFKEVLYLTSASKFYTSKSIYTSDFFEDIVSISVVVYNEKGKKMKLKEEDFQIVDSPPSSWVFHDDDKELLFDLKKLGAGYRTEIEYTKRIKQPEFFDLFHFMSGYPVEQASVEIVHPADFELKYYERNLKGFDVTRGNETLKKGNKKTSWAIKNLPEYKTESGSTQIKNHIPHLIAQLVSYTANGNKTQLIGSTAELHGFFQEFLLLSEEKNKDNGQLEEIVDEIIADKTTELEKMDSIFQWVQANIKYIAFEDGINGYVPRACSKVMNDRYGDCKDMGNLLVDMLTYAGVSGAHVAWVGTRDIPYLMSEIPSPLTCNHVICVVDRTDGQDDYYYLDATNDQGGYLLPPRNVQSKELLIHNGIDDFRLFTVPTVEAKNNYIKSVIHYAWDEDDSLRGTGTDYYGGYERTSRTYRIDNLDNEDLFDYIKDMVLGGFNRYTLSSYDVENLYKKNEQLIINYAFSVDNLFIKDGEDLILNPTLFKPRITQYNLEDHSLTRMKSRHRTIDYQFEFEIPEGYKVKHLPENVTYNHEKFEFLGTFKNEGGMVKVGMMYQYHLLEIPTSLYPEWNKFSEAINQATIQNIILEKI